MTTLDDLDEQERPEPRDDRFVDHCTFCNELDPDKLHRFGYSPSRPGSICERCCTKTVSNSCSFCGEPDECRGVGRQVGGRYRRVLCPPCFRRTYDIEAPPPREEAEA